MDGYPIKANARFALQGQPCKKPHKVDLGYRQFQVMQLLKSAILDHGRAPCFSEIRDALGFLDKRDVRNVVRRLEKRGMVFRCGYTDSGKGQPVIRLSLSPPLESQ